jgi:aldehyde dehydrogenase (NAD+)
MQTITEHYIDGAFVESHGREGMDIIKPTNGKVIARATLGDEEDTRRAIAAAKRAFVTRPIVQSGANAFLAAERGLQELPWTRSWGKTTVTLEPVGVAGLITAWNANALFICLKLDSAVGAGCTVVIKPSELSSLQTQVMIECLNAAKLPKGVYNVVTGRGDVVGAELVRNPDVAKISFTGSVAVGEKIMRDGAATMKRVTLELGRQIAQPPARRRRLRQGSPDGPRHRILEQRSGLRRRNPTSRAEEPTRCPKTNHPRSG